MFEVLKIDKTLELEPALRTAVLRLQERKKRKAFSWERNGFIYYNKKGEGIIKRAIEESALVNSFKFCKIENSPDQHILCLREAIVKHLFKFPSLAEMQGGKDLSKILDLPFSKLHNKSFESKDDQINSDFLNVSRHGSDVEKYLSLMKMPWSKTKKILLKVYTGSRYYPEKYQDARLPAAFYLNLKKEHNACHTLRKISYALELSLEKGYPVIEQKRVVTPDAYGTDYHTMRLPRVMASENEAGEVYLDWEPNSFREKGRKRSYDGGVIKVRTLDKHPLYPSQQKVDAILKIDNYNFGIV